MAPLAGHEDIVKVVDRVFSAWCPPGFQSLRQPQVHLGVFVLSHDVVLQVVLVRRDVVAELALLIPDHEVDCLLVSQDAMPVAGPVLAAVAGDESLAVHPSQGTLVMLFLMPAQELGVCGCEVAVGALNYFLGVV